MAKVEIYTKASCGYCRRAKRLFEMKQVEVIEYGVDSGGPTRDEMIERTGGQTRVPQIFINDRHIGGCDELMELESDRKLDELLAA